MPDKSQPISRQSEVTLREINKETVGAICRLSVADDQRQFVAANAYSIAQAHFEEKAWFRAIYADESPVGFIMLSDDPEEPSYFLWRLMIDSRYQKCGFGRRAVERLIDYVKTRPNADALLVSHGQGEGSPAGFYQHLGFVYTGEVDDGELVMKLPLNSANEGGA